MNLLILFVIIIVLTVMIWYLFTYDGHYQFGIILLFSWLILLFSTITYIHSTFNPNNKKMNQLWLTGIYSQVPEYPDSSLTLKIANLSEKLISLPRVISLENIYPNSKHFLKPGDFIEINIDSMEPENGLIESWNIRYRVSGSVLRLDGECINADVWLGIRDTISFVMTARSDTQRFYLISHDGKILMKVGSSVAFKLFRMPLREGYPLYSILKIKAIKNDSFAKIFENIKELSKHILIVRKVKGDIKSPLGIVVIPFVKDTSVYYSHGDKREMKLIKEEREVVVSNRHILSLGLGHRNVWGLRLSRKLTRDGRIVFYFTNPIRWELPPSDTFVIYLGSKGLPLDGYFINVRNKLYSVVYKSLFDKGKLKVISDTLITIGKMDEFYVGKRNFGIVMKLWNFKYHPLKILPIIKPLKVGLWNYIAWLGFLVFTLIFINLNKKIQSDERIRIKTLILFYFISILAWWKYIISFRLASIPPTNASPNELKYVFLKAYVIGFWGLILIPLVFIVALMSHKWLIPYVESKLGGFDDKYITAGLSFYYIFAILLIITSKNEVVSVGPIRLRAYAFLTLFILINYLVIKPDFFASYLSTITHNRLVKEGLYHFVVFLFPLLMYLFFVGDMGIAVIFGIFGVSLLIYKIFSSDYKHRKKILIFVIILFIALLKIPIINMQRLDLRSGKMVYYRFITYKGYTEEYLLSNEQNMDERIFDNLYRNSAQAWQMRLYAAEGGILGKGIGRTKLSNVGLTYPTSLSDASFSIIILSEFGLVGGLFFIIIYTMLGFYLYIFTWSEKNEYLSLLLLTIFSFEPLYMIAGNLQIVPFTGQNIPLLSFHSISDLLMVIFTLLVGISLHHVAGSQKIIKNHRKSQILIGLLLLLDLIVVLGMVHVILKKSYRSDFDLSERLKKHIMFDVSEYFRYDPHYKKVKFRKRNEILPKLLPIEKVYIEQLNNRENPKDPRGGLFYVVDDTIIAMNYYYFRIPSPFKYSPPRINIYGKYDPRPIFAVYLNKEFLLLMGNRGFPQSIDISQGVGTASTFFLTGQSVNVKLHSRTLFSLALRSDSVLVSPAGRIYRGYDIKIDHKKLMGEVKLNNLDIIRIKTRRKEMYLIYLGFKSVPLLYTVWRNGKIDRFLSPVGRGMPFLYLIASQYRTEKQQDIYLTIDPILQIRLTDAIKRYVQSRNRWYRNKDPLSAKIVALTIMDLYTGKILALAQWPEIHESFLKIQEKLYKIPSNKHWRLLSSFNFKNHAVGSTIKPLTLSAIAYKYNGIANVQSLRFLDRADMRLYNNRIGHYHISLAGLPLERPWNCRPGRRDFPRNPEWIDAKNFIIKSMDFYEVMLCMMGMIPHESEFLRFFLSDERENTNIQIGRNIAYLTFDTTHVLRNLRQSGVNDSVINLIQSDYPFIIRGRAVEISQATTFKNLVLFQGFRDLFDVKIFKGRNERDIIDSLYKLEAEKFLRLSKERLNSSYLYHILPEPIIVNSTKFINFRTDLIPFFLGGGENRWNNVKMAESFARIITGKRINAKIVEYSSIFDTMPTPLNNSRWRFRNIITPMEGTWENSVGTFYRMNNYLRRNVPPGYKIIFKTGTIEEREESGKESELLAFIFGRWSDNNINFISDSSVTGYFYIEDSKNTNSRGHYKLRLFEQIFPYIKDYLTRRFDY